MRYLKARIEDIAFHPAADNVSAIRGYKSASLTCASFPSWHMKVCAVSAGSCVKLWDLEKCEQKASEYACMFRCVRVPCVVLYTCGFTYLLIWTSVVMFMCL